MKIEFKTILLIHSNEEKFRNLSSMLIRAGYYIISEKYGNAALKILRRANIDLVVSSGALPDMSSKKFLTEINSLNYSDRTIFISDQRSMEEYFQYGLLGLYYYATRNISPKNIFLTVKDFFEDLRPIKALRKTNEVSASPFSNLLQRTRNNLHFFGYRNWEEKRSPC
jgi:DNA-binding NtrC family response regulator